MQNESTPHNDFNTLYRFQIGNVLEGLKSLKEQQGQLEPTDLSSAESDLQVIRMSYEQNKKDLSPGMRETIERELGDAENQVNSHIIEQA